MQSLVMATAAHRRGVVVLFLISSLAVLLSILVSPTWAQLQPDFYDQVCPKALPTIKAVVEQAISRESRMGASLLRLHFHDCFVNGCDGSVLLDDTATFIGEKTAPANFNSARGFEVVDQIKAAVDEACYGNVVSCADILAVAARDSVAALGGQCYEVLLGRRDSRTASNETASRSIPSPFSNFPTLLSNFTAQGLTLQDLVVLSGAHTLGFAQCRSFRGRVANDTDIDPSFRSSLQQSCPPTGAGGGSDANLTPLDGTSPAKFDTVYFDNLLQKKGLLHSDQQLFQIDGGDAGDLVRYYSENPEAFWADFGVSMVKMGNINPLTGTSGEIRVNCRKVNY